MYNKQLISIRFCSFLIGLIITGEAFSQTVTNDFQTRTELKLTYKPLDKLTLKLNPELRLDESFQVSKYILESSVSYEPLKGLSLGGGYRFIINPRSVKSTAYLHRFSLFTSYSKKLDRFKPSVRIKYTNYSEDFPQGEFLRYRAKLEYNIKKSKISPIISAEAFHDISENQIYKIRYAIGAQYKLNKKSSLELGYMLDYYMQEYRNKHIINLRYKYKF